MVAKTDRGRGVADYRGRSGPVWRTAANTAARAPLLSASEGRVADIRYAGKDSGEARVIVTPGTTAETFTIELSHPISGTVRLTDVSADPKSPRFVQPIVLRDAYKPNAPWTVVVTGQGIPTSQSRLLTPLYHVGAVDTGMITYPLARYARMILLDPVLSKGARLRSARRFMDVAERAVAFHDDEWSEGSDVTAGYVAPKGSPIPGDGSELPFNQSHAVGQTLAELFRITKRSDYSDKVHGLARSWRTALRPGRNGGVVWNHWPPFSPIFQGFIPSDRVSLYTPTMHPSHQWEDLSHGAITAEFLTAAHNAGVAATTDDLRVLVDAYLKELRLGPDTIRDSFNGPQAQPAEAAQSARWMGLGDRTVANHVRDVTRDIDAPARLGSAVLGQAYLAWANSRKL